MTGQPIDIEEIAKRAAEVNLGPWRPGVGIVHCIPTLVDELREARVRLAEIRALHYDSDTWCAECEFAWPCRTVRALDGNPSECLTCNGIGYAASRIRYTTDDRGHETRCPTCQGTGDAA